MFYSEALSHPKKSEEFDGKLVARALPAMGGIFKYSCFPQPSMSRMEVLRLFELAHSEVIRIEDKLTDFRDSPFQQINELAGISPVRVDDEIFSLIKYSILTSKKCGGKFDISFASIGHPWREARSEKGRRNT